MARGPTSYPSRISRHLDRSKASYALCRSRKIMYRTFTLKANLLQQLAALREEVLYVIFLDLHKAYDALDRSRCLEILEGYGVGPRARRLLQTY